MERESFSVADPHIENIFLLYNSFYMTRVGEQVTSYMCLIIYFNNYRMIKHVSAKSIVLQWADRAHTVRQLRYDAARCGLKAIVTGTVSSTTPYI